MGVQLNIKGAETMRLARRSDDLRLPLEKLMNEFRIAIPPVSVEQGRIGHDAYGRYGRGTEHPAEAQSRRLLRLTR